MQFLTLGSRCMKATTMFFAIALGCFTAASPLICRAADEPAKAEGKFVPLFNGKDLAGWHGDPELWKVVDGVIVGSTDDKEIKKNTFLISDKSYKNFVLKAKFRLRNHNSGIQFRSIELTDPKYGCKGY